MRAASRISSGFKWQSPLISTTSRNSPTDLSASDKMSQKSVSHILPGFKEHVVFVPRSMTSTFGTRFNDSATHVSCRT
uniref:Secreted protein n=1 Tax=Steinernema glaseri TaxID=37863 RepID=A0A1I7YRR3_9BILA